MNDAQRRRPRPIRSWAEHLELRDKLRTLAARVLAADAKAAAAAEARGWSATGAICAAIRDPSLTTCSEVAEAGQLFRELRDLQACLIWSHNLDGNMVVMEATMILDAANAAHHQRRVDSLLSQEEVAVP